jgi:hypothetical protein
MKLELKHIAPYLPYGLKFRHFDGERELITTCDFAEITPEEIVISNNMHEYAYKIGSAHVMPILRNLSDLTKEIEHNGERFVPNISIHEDELFQTMLAVFSIGEFFIEDINYGIVEKLFEWHFDVFRLIDAGLAIDINTLDK